MEIQQIESGRTTVLALTGRLDSSNAIELSNQLRALYAKPGRLLLLDFQQVDYITSLCDEARMTSDILHKELAVVTTLATRAAHKAAHAAQAVFS